MSDIVDRLERVVRRHVLRSLPAADQAAHESDSLASLLIDYRTWRARFVRPVPRAIRRAPSLAGHPRVGAYRSALDAIEHKIVTGIDLTPHLSRRVARLGRDLLLADWGVHHLHLSTSLDPDGFVSRTGDVLFVAFTATDAYLLDIRKHERDGDNWAAEEVFATLVRNWPESGLVHQAEGVLGLSQKYTDEERRELRSAGIAQVMEIDGKVYLPGGLGMTTAGTPIQATRAANAFMWDLNGWRNGDPYRRLQRLSGTREGTYWCPSVHVVAPGFEEVAGFIAGSRFVPIGANARIV